MQTIKPKEGFTTKAKLLRVIDGDTIEVEVTRRFPLRLIHPEKRFNAPELSTKEGVEAKEFVEGYCYGASDITIFIPAGCSDVLTDINSFNRLLGEVWVGNKNLVDVIMEHGYGELK
jgi:endonuclease YncB( thermonuclease family)